MSAVTNQNANQLYPPTRYIKAFVKQIDGYKDLKNEAAGVLTQVTVNTIKQLFSDSVGTPSELCDRHDKLLGAIYIHTNVQSRQKYHVICSTGKQMNCILAFPYYLHENAPSFIDKWLNSLDNNTKLQLSCSLYNIANSEENQLEMLYLSKHVKKKIVATNDVIGDSTKQMLIYLILIGISKNEQHVKSVAVNYRAKSVHQQVKRTL